MERPSEVSFGEIRLFVATLMFRDRIRVSPAFFVLIPKEYGGVDIWEGSFDRLTSLSRAYTRNGLSLERGEFPWGYEDTVFVHTLGVHAKLLRFEARRDVDGFRAYCDEYDAGPFPRTFQR